MLEMMDILNRFPRHNRFFIRAAPEGVRAQNLRRSHDRMSPAKCQFYSKTQPTKLALGCRNSWHIIRYRCKRKHQFSVTHT